MARSITQIYDTIQEARTADPVLASLNSPSATAVHRLWAYITAVVLFMHETIWDRHKADVDAALARAKPGTPTWYAEEMLKFQLGDTLVADDDGIHYAAGSTGAQIITRATAKENDTTGRLQLFIKVAKNGTAAGTLAALSGAELTQARGYIDRKRFAGTNLQVVSRDADRLRLEGEVHYDPLLELEGDTGLKALVRTAVAGYLATLDFDGQVFLSKIVDAIQLVPGVKDVLLTKVTARSGAAVPTEIERVYETQAGYIVEDDASGAGFADTLTFVPYA